MTERMVNEIRNQYRPDMRIMLVEMNGEPQMPCGLYGVVRFVDDIGQVHMRWENGSRLALHPYEDIFEIVG